MDENNLVEVTDKTKLKNTCTLKYAIREIGSSEVSLFIIKYNLISGTIIIGGVATEWDNINNVCEEFFLQSIQRMQIRKYGARQSARINKLLSDGDEKTHDGYHPDDIPDTHTQLRKISYTFGIDKKNFIESMNEMKVSEMYEVIQIVSHRRLL